MAENSWAQIAAALEAVLRMRRKEWGCSLPLFDSQIDLGTEQLVDAWCLVFAMDLLTPQIPPPEVQPWILARLLSAQSLAQVLADAGDTEAPELSPTTLAHVLIEEWHAVLKDRWHLMQVPPWLH